ncbi:MULTISPECIES: TorF family putative porin [Novosphingobium]|uniref:Porin n=1 Tax=Novosphingobium mathurense TaxID=428990 RepID=A0A1U6GRS0_9SPHN|nr:MULTISPECIES: TorF family putative porin [Novosphingobium]CDO37078.1 conserved exported hypothetical protein [Novosphingobium sp. KN65.2]SLJ86198.1 protein of unknown function (Gcw_chp) [Novosphingobium mathurense]
MSLNPHYALAVALPLILASAPACAQSMEQTGASIEATTDYREDGLSWSDSAPALRAEGTLALSHDLSISASVATLRGSRRHGGSDWGFTIAPRYSTSAAGWDLSAGIAGHLFAGADDGAKNLDYVELEGRAARTLGPAQLALSVSYAPSQDAIGGSYGHAGADLGVGLPGTPITAYAGGGYAFGNSNGDARSTRLRPDGNYANWYVGAEQSFGPIAVGVLYSDTSIDRHRAAAVEYGDKGTGERLSAYARVSL